LIGARLTSGRKGAWTFKSYIRSSDECFMILSKSKNRLSPLVSSKIDEMFYREDSSTCSIHFLTALHQR
jgi:hypothetical protein